MNKEEQLLEKRLIELSNLAFSRDIVTFSDFLNLIPINRKSTSNFSICENVLRLQNFKFGRQFATAINTCIT